MKTAKIVLSSIKDHGWWDLLLELGLLAVKGEDGCDGSEPISAEVAEKINQHFKYGEYASIEIEVDDDMNIIGGRILRLDEG